jgi:chitodextrinase
MKTLNSLLLSLVTSLFGAVALAQPTLLPSDDGGIRTFDGPVEKYILFNPPSGVTHSGHVMHWYYNDANRPAAVSKSATLAQIEASQAKWSAVCNITFDYQGETATGFSLPTSSIDGVNVIGWDPTGLTVPTTGLTQIAWNGSNTIVDAEIRLNAAYSATYSPASNFAATLTHEVGHSIGLDHSDVSNQVMSGPPHTAYDGVSVLGSDDISGCVHLYGAPGGGGGPAPDTQAPSVPTALAATANGTAQVNLAWHASTDNVGVTSYKVYQGGTSLGSVSIPSATVTGLSAGTLYSFTVSACDAAGNCSAQSSSASATTQAAAPPPTCTGSQPPNDQQVLACPAGQAGSIAQSRGYSCVGTTWTPGAWQTTSNTCTSLPAQSYQDMWWAGANENGWGLTITQHGDKLFLAFYIYGAAGDPMWVVLPSGTWNAAHNTYSGDLYIPTGSSFTAYNVARFSAGASVGNASINFDTNSSGTLSYVVRGVAGTKRISRLAFGIADATPIASYADMWWAGTAENGWGLVLSQQYHNLFAAWYTYDASGQTTWFVMPNGTWTSGNVYSGALYRTRGTPVIGSVYDPSALVVTQAGMLTLTFSNTGSATMTYTVDGATQSKPITRLPF